MRSAGALAREGHRLERARLQPCQNKPKKCTAFAAEVYRLLLLCTRNSPRLCVSLVKDALRHLRALCS
jgi:hypothetical protein